MCFMFKITTSMYVYNSQGEEIEEVKPLFCSFQKYIKFCHHAVGVDPTLL